jgi:4,5-DOPA dioxygenase extradiol
MKRNKFLKALALLPFAASAMKLNALHQLTDPLPASEVMPVLFLGHGSPMNAIEDNEFTLGWKTVGKTLPRPKIILCVSAHWETPGTFVTAMEKPPTIHDFGGFPKELYAVQYPAPGSPSAALDIQRSVHKTTVGLDESWGLDHGAWSVIKHLYPNADIPVLQLSLDYNQPPQYHFELAKELASLRSKGVLIIGSGNMVHNLRMAAWDKMHEPNFGFDWALEASEKMKKSILSGDYDPLIQYKSQGKAFDLAIPSPDHFLPLLYALALRGAHEKITLFNDKPVMGSLTMTSVKIEKA